MRNSVSFPSSGGIVPFNSKPDRRISVTLPGKPPILMCSHLSMRTSALQFIEALLARVSRRPRRILQSWMRPGLPQDAGTAMPFAHGPISGFLESAEVGEPPSDAAASDATNAATTDRVTTNQMGGLVMAPLFLFSALRCMATDETVVKVSPCERTKASRERKASASSWAIPPSRHMILYEPLEQGYAEMRRRSGL